MSSHTDLGGRPPKFGRTMAALNQKELWWHTVIRELRGSSNRHKKGQNFLNPQAPQPV